MPPHGAHGAPGSWGGHAVSVVAYDALTLTVITWGALKIRISGFWGAYCDEAYAVLSADFVNKSGISVSGIDIAGLQADWALVTN